MNTYDDLVNDYLRAVGQAMAGVPASRRDELLADLGQHIAAKRAELTPEGGTEVEVRSILELLGDPEDVAAEAMIDAVPEPPIVIQPGKKLSAMAWVLITIAAVLTLCVVTVLVGALFLPSRFDGPKSVPGEPSVQLSPSIQLTPSPS
jgi:uncharacterized membrane protein